MTTLAYHDVVAEADFDRSGFPGPLAARYKLTPELFEQHLEAIAGTGVAVFGGGSPTPGDLLLTFDDGGLSALEIGAALERRGWRGLFFVVTGLVGDDGFLSAEQVVELAGRGHLVGSHSHSHPTYMARLSPAELDDEWGRSRAVLGEILGEPPALASVPGGFYAEPVAAAAAAAGFSTLFTSTPTDRVAHVGSVEVRGRYAIWSSTPARVAADYTRPRSLARLRLETEWRLKHAAKSISPSFYDTLRRLRARR